MVVWFLTICSIVVHGLSIPLGKLGFFLPRTLSRAFTSQTNSQTNLAIGARVYSSNAGTLRERRRPNGGDGSVVSASTTPVLSSGTSTRSIYRIGGSVIRSGAMGSGMGGTTDGEDGIGIGSPVILVDGVGEGRTIRFPDQEAHIAGGGKGRDLQV